MQMWDIRIRGGHAGYEIGAIHRSGEARVSRRSSRPSSTAIILCLHSMVSACPHFMSKPAATSLRIKVRGVSFAPPLPLTDRAALDFPLILGFVDCTCPFDRCFGVLFCDFRLVDQNKKCAKAVQYELYRVAKTSQLPDKATRCWLTCHTPKEVQGCSKRQKPRVSVMAAVM